MFLKNSWYVAAWDREIADRPLGRLLLNEPVVMFRDKAGQVTRDQVREIAERKMKDLNCDSIESAMKMVEGSARSMGLEVAG